MQSDAFDPVQATQQRKTEGQGWIEERSRDTEPDPCVDGEGETEAQAGEEETIHVWDSADCGSGSDACRGLASDAKGEEEEHGGTNKLAEEEDKFILDGQALLEQLPVSAMMFAS